MSNKTNCAYKIASGSRCALLVSWGGAGQVHASDSGAQDLRMRAHLPASGCTYSEISFLFLDAPKIPLPTIRLKNERKGAAIFLFFLFQ
jgi:hypothetical protein